MQSVKLKVKNKAVEFNHQGTMTHRVLPGLFLSRFAVKFPSLPKVIQNCPSHSPWEGEGVANQTKSRQTRLLLRLFKIL
jgi:hypothetical protein